ncbi:hypothetical protein DV737_g4549, partial [Chaetothyriales sp. CBS 132003]
MAPALAEFATFSNVLAVLKAAAKKLQCFALLRSGGVPGVMYVQGESKSAVQSWVDTVHGLRYKDYQLVAPHMLGEAGVLEEVDRVRDMAGRIMEGNNARVTEWWRKAMGFVC